MSDLKFTLRFDAENKQFIGQVNQAGDAVTKLGGSANTTQGKLKGLSTQSTQTSANLGSLKNQVLGVASGFSALYAANQAADKLGQYQDIRTQITALVGGQEEWIETEQYLNQVSKDHNKTLVDMSGNYARLASLQEAGLISQKESREIFEGMSNVQSQAGASTVQLGQSMYGLSQALASPIVRAEELNQVVEPMPGLLNKLDEAAGLSAGGFRRMMLAGEVTSSFFKETLIAALSEYDGAAARTADNINAKYAENTRAYEKAVVAFEAPISDSFSAMLETSAGAMELFAEHADLVTTIVEVSMVAALSRGAIAVQAITAAKVKDIAAARAKEQANIAELRSLEAKLVAEVRELEVMQLSNNQKFRAIGAETSLTAKRAQLTATTTTLTAAQARLNVVARAGSGIMAMLGGPAGVAIMAAAAVGYFAKAAYDAQDPTKRLKEEASELVTEYQSLNEVGKRRLFQSLGTEASTARTQLLSVRAEIRKVTQEMLTASSPAMSSLKQSQLSQLKQEAKALEITIDGANQKFNALLTTNTKNTWKAPKEESDSSPKTDPKLGDQANKLLDNLRKQNALYGETSEAAKLKYEIEYGSLKGINDELAKKLMLEAQALDKKRADDEEPDTSSIDAFYDESDQLQTAYLQRLSMQASLESQAVAQEKSAYTEKNIALSESFQSAYEQAVGNQELMDALEREYFSNREILRADHEMNLTDISKEAEQQRQAYQHQVAMDTLGFTQQQLSITTNFLRNAGKEQSGVYQALFAVQKMAAIPSMIISTEEAATKALTLGPIAGPIAAASVKALGYASVGIVAGQAFAGQAHDGINRVPKSNEGTWMLKANEMVLNPTQADNFRWMVDMMSQMQTMQAAASTAAYGSAQSGGQPVTINVTGVDKSKVSATASYGKDGLTIDMLINQAVDASMNAMYDDADNGGRVSKRIRKG